MVWYGVVWHESALERVAHKKEKKGRLVLFRGRLGARQTGRQGTPGKIRSIGPTPAKEHKEKSERGACVRIQTKG